MGCGASTTAAAGGGGGVADTPLAGGVTPGAVELSGASALSESSHASSQRRALGGSERRRRVLYAIVAHTNVYNAEPADALFRQSLAWLRQEQAGLRDAACRRRGDGSGGGGGGGGSDSDGATGSDDSGSDALVIVTITQRQGAAGVTVRRSRDGGDMNVTVRSPNGVWGTSSLVNLARRLLPPSAAYLAWMDAGTVLVEPAPGAGAWVSAVLDQVAPPAAAASGAAAHLLLCRSPCTSRTGAVWAAAASTLTALGGLPPARGGGTVDDALVARTRAAGARLAPLPGTVTVTPPPLPTPAQRLRWTNAAAASAAPPSDGDSTPSMKAVHVTVQDPEPAAGLWNFPTTHGVDGVRVLTPQKDGKLRGS